jgi:hypothetical protein
MLEKIITVAFFSAFKFIVGFGLAVSYQFNFFEFFISIVGGGMLGTFLYLYVWQFISILYRKIVPKKPSTIKFSKRTRWVVKIIKKYELYGVAFLSPLILTLPIGCLIANQIETNKWRIKLFMFVSLSAWTVLFWLLRNFIVQMWFNK